MQQLEPHQVGIIKALYKGIIDPRTPLLAKVLPFLILIYIIFPFDIVPDFVPFAGYVDDIVVVPLGLWLAMKLIPDSVILQSGQELIAIIRRVQRAFFWTGVVLAVMCALVLGGVIFLISRAFF